MRVSALTLACTAVLIGGIFTFGSSQNAANGEDPGNNGQNKRLYLIEEDWEMAINVPEVATHSPQIAFFTCPNANDDDSYFQLQMNYHADTDFSGGGFHVGAFSSGTRVDEARSRTRIPLRIDNDRIRWTNVMATVNGKYLFAVSNGSGDDWGKFGGPEYLVSMPADDSNNLDKYDYKTSQEMVDIGFGGNRVKTVRLIRVRYFYSDGSRKTVQVHESIF